MPLTGYLWRGGSYQELEDGLEELSLVSRQRLWEAYVHQPSPRYEQVAFKAKNEKELAWDLEALSRLLPRDIRVPADIIENWTGQRRSKW